MSINITCVLCLFSFLAGMLTMFHWLEYDFGPFLQENQKKHDNTKVS